MANKEIFSKVLPNIKLATRLDAEGKEIDVEVRVDSEETQARKKILDLFLSAGYFRVMIKTLSDFDKIVGGIVWCIEACEFEVDVDLLFHENLTIGQKISLTEKIVVVLPQMKCPFMIEPHQIQGLDFINIFPVIQWLIKESVNLRNEKAERLKIFAVGQFHNHFSLSSSEKARAEREETLKAVKIIEDLFLAKRLFKRKQNVEPDDEKSRVRLTLLEYGIRNIARSIAKASDEKLSKTQAINVMQQLDRDMNDEIDVDQLQSENLAVAKEEIYENANLTVEERQEISKHYENLKMEMLIDAKELSEQNKIKALEAMESALEKRLHRVIQENEGLSDEIKKDENIYEQIKSEGGALIAEMKRLETQNNEADELIKSEIKELILQNEKLKQEEIAFKEDCKKYIEDLYKNIEDSESLANRPDDDLLEYDQMLENESENLRIARLQLAKKNRAVISIQRQLDNIPDNVELSQYQRRFLELYNQVSSKHKETKQFYALYNTLNDTHLWMDKELTILNSIYDNYNQAMSTPHSKEQFLKKLEDIVEGAQNSKAKIKRKNDEEKIARDRLNAEHMSYVELERKYALMIRQFKIACERN